MFWNRWSVAAFAVTVAVVLSLGSAWVPTVLGQRAARKIALESTIELARDQLKSERLPLDPSVRAADLPEMSKAVRQALGSDTSSFIVTDSEFAGRTQSTVWIGLPGDGRGVIEVHLAKPADELTWTVTSVKPTSGR